MYSKAGVTRELVQSLAQVIEQVSTIMYGRHIASQHKITETCSKSFASFSSMSPI